jgi:dTDP-4-dehydrorhamnose 3,5-epimerase
MNVSSTELPGVIVIEPRVYQDSRGHFIETWNRARYAEAGLPSDFVQDNLSFSTRGVLRGLHLQHPHPQGKLIHVLHGEVFDVAVDVRVGSPTFGRWVGETLSAGNRRQIYVPPGFAHGFAVTGDSALVVYKCTEGYRPQCELSLKWDDPVLAIRWPVAEPVVSGKDSDAPRLDEVIDRLPRYDLGSR